MKPLIIYTLTFVAMVAGVHIADAVALAKTVSYVPAQVPQPTVEVLESQDVHGLQTALSPDTLQGASQYLQGSSPELQGQSLPVQVR